MTFEITSIDKEMMIFYRIERKKQKKGYCKSLSFCNSLCFL